MLISPSSNKNIQCCCRSEQFFDDSSPQCTQLLLDSFFLQKEFNTLKHYYQNLKLYNKLLIKYQLLLDHLLTLPQPQNLNSPQQLNPNPFSRKRLSRLRKFKTIPDPINIDTLLKIKNPSESNDYKKPQNLEINSNKIKDDTYPLSFLPPLHVDDTGKRYSLSFLSPL